MKSEITLPEVLQSFSVNVDSGEALLNGKNVFSGCKGFYFFGDLQSETERYRFNVNTGSSVIIATYNSEGERTAFSKYKLGKSRINKTFLDR